MQASTVGTPTASRYGTIFITIELSQKSWLVTLHSPDQDKLSRHQLAGGDHAGLVALIDRIRDRAARALGGVPAVASCYEAGYDGFRSQAVPPPAGGWRSCWIGGADRPDPGSGGAGAGGRSGGGELLRGRLRRVQISSCPATSWRVAIMLDWWR